MGTVRTVKRIHRKEPAPQHELKRGFDAYDVTTPDIYTNNAEAIMGSSETQGIALHTLQTRMSRDAELLYRKSPKLFKNYIEEQSRKLNEGIDDPNPLAFVIGSNADDPYLDDLILPEGIYLSESECD